MEDYKKKYEGLKNRIREAYSSEESNVLKKCLEGILPELKESEDEKIKDEIKVILANTDFSRFALDYTFADMLTWLEKQGEQKPFDYENANIQQKDFESIEPKFKIGNWVVDSQGLTHQIKRVLENVTTHTFGYDIVGGGYFNDNTEGVRLWTIEDAKPGDVLAAEVDSHQFIALYKEHGLDFFNSYCFIDTRGTFHPIEETGHSLINIHPATKEQRDLLFQKMKEAGYEWNADKKELVEMC